MIFCIGCALPYTANSNNFTSILGCINITYTDLMKHATTILQEKKKKASTAIKNALL